MNILILGAGEIGYHIALSLSRENREVILVEADSARADQIDDDENDIQVVRGNAADPDVLLAAGLKTADLLVAVTNRDEVNITACLFAARLAPAVRRVARIRQVDLRVHGRLLTDEPTWIHAVIHPEELCARKIRDVLHYPGTTDVDWFFDGHVALVSIPVTEDAPVNGWDLARIGQERLARGLSFLIATHVHDGSARIPSAHDVFMPGDTLYVATLANCLNEVLALFVPPERLKPIRETVIFGGGATGWHLAEMLEDAKLNVKLIEPDPRRAAWLADRLNTTLVLCGEPADQGIFQEENIAGADAYVAVTADQEDNLIAALHAKSFGIRHTVVTLYRAHLAPLVRRTGVDTLVLPQAVAVGKILEHVRAGDISSVIVMEQHGMEIIEAHVPQGSRLIGRPLRQQRMPRGTLLLAYQRSETETLIPDGNTTIMAGDRIAVISHQRNTPKVEAMLRAGRHG